MTVNGTDQIFKTNLLYLLVSESLCQRLQSEKITKQKPTHPLSNGTKKRLELRQYEDAPSQETQTTQ